tara:strand:+ start:203 stop:604 length:402 start_codon:yes stop_codon:yes gene_type:complete
MNGYFAVELKKSDSKLVSKRAIFPNLVSDHITLAYKPSKRLYNKFIKLVGKNVGAVISAYRANENIDALWVTEMFLTDTDTKIKRANPGSAHITLSLKDGFKPGDANSMFKKPKIKKDIIGYVEGKINYIKLN